MVLHLRSPVLAYLAAIFSVYSTASKLLHRRNQLHGKPCEAVAQPQLLSAAYINLDLLLLSDTKTLDKPLEQGPLTWSPCTSGAMSMTGMLWNQRLQYCCRVCSAACCESFNDTPRMRQNRFCRFNLALQAPQRCEGSRTGRYSGEELDNGERMQGDGKKREVHDVAVNRLRSDRLR